MSTIHIILDGHGCWPDCTDEHDKQMIDTVVSVAFTPKGTLQGNPVIGIRLQRPDGSFTVARVTLAAWRAATRAFEGREQYLADLERRGGPTS